MVTDLTIVLYLIVYILSIIYLTILGCYMLAQRGNVMSTHGEQKAKKRMTRTMGIAMFVWVFDLFIYLPPMLMNIPMNHPIQRVLFLFNLMTSIPVVYSIMFVIVQRQVNTLRWCCALAAPFFVLTVWNCFMLQSETPLYVGAVLGLVSQFYLLIRFVKEYRIYVRRIQSEYSDTSRREILWSWLSFFGFAVQVILYVGYFLMWSPFFEIFYFIISLVNASGLCYGISRQRPIDLDVVEEDAPKAAALPVVKEEKEKAFYAIIEKKLEANCEGQLLYLEPELTREQLCRRLSISSTYLKMYFHSRGLSFYQYINTLRVEYAYKLMQEHPDMSIVEVSRQSGFRSQTTFRKMFQEVIGCLPSEVKKQ